MVNVKASIIDFAQIDLDVICVLFCNLIFILFFFFFFHFLLQTAVYNGLQSFLGLEGPVLSWYRNTSWLWKTNFWKQFWMFDITLLMYRPNLNNMGTMYCTVVYVSNPDILDTCICKDACVCVSLQFKGYWPTGGSLS